MRKLYSFSLLNLFGCLTTLCELHVVPNFKLNTCHFLQTENMM